MVTTGIALAPGSSHGPVENFGLRMLFSDGVLEQLRRLKMGLPSKIGQSRGGRVDNQ